MQSWNPLRRPDSVKHSIWQLVTLTAQENRKCVGNRKQPSILVAKKQVTLSPGCKKFWEGIKLLFNLASLVQRVTFVIKNSLAWKKYYCILFRNYNHSTKEARGFWERSHNLSNNSKEGVYFQQKKCIFFLDFFYNLNFFSSLCTKLWPCGLLSQQPSYWIFLNGSLVSNINTVPWPSAECSTEPGCC